ncbi:hypothetical protein ACFL35_13195 [Candidatus Riflebacteria bacterium]
MNIEQEDYVQKIYNSLRNVLKIKIEQDFFHPQKPEFLQVFPFKNVLKEKSNLFSLVIFFSACLQIKKIPFKLYFFNKNIFVSLNTDDVKNEPIILDLALLQRKNYWENKQNSLEKMKNLPSSLWFFDSKESEELGLFELQRKAQTDSDPVLSYW